MLALVVLGLLAAVAAFVWSERKLDARNRAYGQQLHDRILELGRGSK